MRSWRDQAKCRGLDPEIFFPDPEIEEDADEAIAICMECRVQEACLENAIARREKDGVWGGATVKERRRIIRRRRRSA
ncbi:MAG: WhiB family transcriptional regulator [Actinobacteria bacterium ATB1]|nr:WhiB family transcriptional regulator [Actinobacteria bacterium ATB1]